MQRITQKDLENLLTLINTKAGYGPNPPYNTVGAYTLSSAYGGWKIEVFCQGGGVRTITNGYVTKRELYGQMQAFLRGLTIKQEA